MSNSAIVINISGEKVNLDDICPGVEYRLPITPGVMEGKSLQAWQEQVRAMLDEISDWTFFDWQTKIFIVLKPESEQIIALSMVMVAFILSNYYPEIWVAGQTKGTYFASTGFLSEAADWANTHRRFDRVKQLISNLEESEEK